jgi:hypothetical protein
MLKTNGITDWISIRISTGGVQDEAINDGISIKISTSGGKMRELVMGLASELAPVGGKEQASRPTQPVESSRMMMMMMIQWHVNTKE